MSNSLGIDLGTTFSEVSVVITGNPQLIADKSNTKNIPSVIYINQDKNGNIKFIVGSNAIKKQILNPESTIYDVKRMLGKKYDDKDIQQMKKQWPFKIERSETGRILICPKGVDRKFHPYELSGELLKYLVSVGNERFPPDQKTRDVVITIPANFGDEQRSETLRAADYADLHVLALLNEPTAAGIAFGLNNVSRINDEHVLVFDFGGGTLDVSLLFISKNEITVKSTAGDMQLGGRNFDENTSRYLIEKLQLGNEYIEKPKKKKEVLENTIEAKISLSSSESTDVIIGEEECELTLDEFNEINKDLIARITAPIDEVLSFSNFNPQDVKHIIIVGGSSNMQFVKSTLSKKFNRDPYQGIDPWEAVGLGAGLLAVKIKNEGTIPHFIQNLKVKDICPFSLGTSNYDGKMDFFIEKNHEIPVEVSKPFSTVVYRQTEFCVDVKEGESNLASENRTIGFFKIENLDTKEGILEFLITFSINENGILSTSAQLVGGDLHGSTSIDIKKVDSNVLNDVENEVYDSNMIVKNFYTNIQRFIMLNKTKLCYYYPEFYLQQTINDALERISMDVNHPDYVEIDQYANGFHEKFKKYFRNNEIPYFINILLH